MFGIPQRKYRHLFHGHPANLPMTPSAAGGCGVPAGVHLAAGAGDDSIDVSGNSAKMLNDCRRFGIGRKIMRAKCGARAGN